MKKAGWKSLQAAFSLGTEYRLVARRSILVGWER